MTDIVIRNYRRIAKADLALSGLVLVAGRNMVGKSSLAQAVRAALCGEWCPLTEHEKEMERLTKKTDLPAFLSYGAESGGASIIDGDNIAQMNWPKGELLTKGSSPPHASRMAAGLESLAWLDHKERALRLVELLQAMPTKDEISAAMGKAKIANAERAMIAVWAIIEKDGWDLAHGKARDKGRALKGQWEEAAQEPYGSAKAAGWRPQGWDPRFEGLSEEDAEGGVKAIEAEIGTHDREAGAKGAINSRLAVLAERLPELEGQVPPDVVEIGKRLEDARAHRGALPSSKPGHPVMCRHCGFENMVAIDKGKLIPVQTDPLTEAERITRAKAEGAADGLIERTERDLAAAKETILRHGRELVGAREAKATLDAAPVEGKGDDSARTALQDRLYRATANLGLIRRKERAGKIASQIADNGCLQAILAPDGLRQEKLDSVLQAFNADLADLSGKMGVGTIALDNNLSIVEEQESREESYLKTYRLPYWRMSESQKFRTRIILQAAFARRDGSSLIVVDNDVDQDRRWLGGTLKMLAAAGIPALVTVRADRPEDAPQRLPPGVEGRVYWLAEADGLAAALPLEEVLRPVRAEAAE